MICLGLIEWLKRFGRLPIFQTNHRILTELRTKQNAVRMHDVYAGRMLVDTNPHKHEEHMPTPHRRTPRSERENEFYRTEKIMKERRKEHQIRKKLERKTRLKLFDSKSKDRRGGGGMRDGWIEWEVESLSVCLSLSCC